MVHLIVGALSVELPMAKGRKHPQMELFEKDFGKMDGQNIRYHN